MKVLRVGREPDNHGDNARPIHALLTCSQPYVGNWLTQDEADTDPVRVDIMYVCMYVCMVITYSKSMGQPGKVASPARGQLNRKNEYFPVRVRA